jgi:hypothetical protein
LIQSNLNLPIFLYKKRFFFDNSKIRPTMALAKAGTVEWDDKTKQTGMLVLEGGSRTRVYAPLRAISETIYEVLHDIIDTPIDAKAKSGRRGRAVFSIYPTHLRWRVASHAIEEAKKRMLFFTCRSTICNVYVVQGTTGVIKLTSFM